ncbi:multidrug resistance protein 2 [Decorospora gaudefroyi]|uniref:Multidrug resistance protein 2 n=1 Tax=Decorospora gaudefroyi TaxID=184978 RepID=A0A6A5KYF5_9PLEO|nr:multidrug resistance protein 2 [Decorospora gaudefroyi]
MATTPASNGTDEHEKTATQADEEQDYISRVGLKALFGFTTKQHLPVILGAVIAAAIAAISMPVFAIIYGFIFREYTSYGAGTTDGDELISNVTKLCIILTGIATLSWVANSVYFFFCLIFGELQARSARTRIFDALIQKDMAWYDMRENGVAAFLPTIQMHIRDLQLSVSAPFGEGVQAFIQAIASLGVALYFSWSLTLVVLATIPLLYLAQAFISSRLSRRAYDQAGKLQSALKYITTAIQSIETVKCYNGERYELQVITKIIGTAAHLYKRVANLRSMQLGIMEFFTVSVFVQGFWYGGHLVNTGNRDPGQVLTTFWATLMAIGGIMMFLPQFIVLQKGKMAGARLAMLMKQIPTSDQRFELQGQTKPARCQGDIEFRKVTFSYPSRADEIAIRNASLFIPAGETTFVIGRSGSGKSTLGQLLVRFYQPSTGQIFLDGVPLEELDVKWLRENVTLVEQHSVLFNDTIRHNLALGNLGDTLNLQDIHDAVRFAMLEPVVDELPDGLDTHLGMKGSSLSGGQKQRMALARARIRNAPVLILDESTSALDYVTRAEVLGAIRVWRKGKTTIIITHDISQIRPDDFLYLLEDARVVQEGYREELEAHDGAFQAFLESHKKQEEDEESDVDRDSYIGEDASEIISLYNEPWSAQATPMPRPLSSILFGQPILRPFLGNSREYWAGNAPVGLAQHQRHSRYEEHEGRQSTRSSMAAAPDDLQPLPGTLGLKAPPRGGSPGPDNFPLKEYGSRPSSWASGHLSRSDPHNRPLSFSKEYGSRPGSVLSTRPVSRHAPYPRPLMMSEAVSVQLDEPKKHSRKKKLLSKMRRSRRTGDIEEQSVSADSLPIMEILKSVWPAIGWGSRLRLWACLLCTLIHSASTPVFAWVFAQLLTTFYEAEGQRQQARNYSLAILGIAIVGSIASYYMFYLSDCVAQSWTLALKTEAMRRILLQPREFFDKEENSMSRLAETMDHFAEEARNLPGRFAVVYLVLVLTVGISIMWSMVISWKLALVALATGPILFAITKCNNMISSRWEKLANEADDKIGQILHETFVNIRTVRGLVLEDHFRKKYNDATTEALQVGIKRALYSGSIFGLNFAGVIFVAILLFWYGGSLIARNEYTVNEVMGCFLILMLSVNHVSQMAHYVTQINMSRVASTRLLRLARLPTTSHELTGTTQIQTAADISLQNVTFTYPTRPDVQVLHNVSFTIPRGSCTAIVGSSGSGKSTIASLLLKLYQPDSTDPAALLPAQTEAEQQDAASHITISAHNITSLHTASLRSHMALVSQTPVLFPGTIAQNIAYALSPSAPEASPASISNAASAAGISDFIDSLPHGYNTMIGEGGTTLSGGQAQRLCIARALVRNPDVLILDEATSALDGAAAHIIRDTVRGLVRGAREGEGEGGESCAGKAPKKKKITVIIITHAREMMAIADRIVMLDKGAVVEQGAFSDLKRRRGGAFWRLLRGKREE